MPSFKGFDKLIAKTKEFAKKNELKEGDIEQAIKKTREK